MDLTITPDDLTAARTSLAGDWDEHGTTTVYLPKEQARILLRVLGYKIEYRPTHNHGEQPVFIAPDGNVIYEADDALQTALVALTVNVND